MGYAKQRAKCTERTRAKLRQSRPPETWPSLRAAAKCGVCVAALLGSRLDYNLRRAASSHPHFAKQRNPRGTHSEAPLACLRLAEHRPRKNVEQQHRRRNQQCAGPCQMLPIVIRAHSELKDDNRQI